jgi:DNA polymerase-3 subunit epsilon
VTLVNPERDVGAVGVHGISASDIIAAPRFEEVAGDIAIRLDDAVLAGHNLRFDVTFLKAEYGRIGRRMPDVGGLCTLRLAQRLYPSLPSRKLVHLCEEAGIQHEDCHSALDDARAAAHLLVHFFGEADRLGCGSLDDLGCFRQAPRCAGAWAPPPSGRAISRERAAGQIRQERDYLARLVERLPGTSGATSPASIEYLSLLDRVLEDRLVTRAEADGLVSFALAGGLSRSHLLDLHREYMSQLVAAALYDGVVSESERRDLALVCDLLGLHQAALEPLLAQPPGAAHPPPAGALVGKTVCFSGEMAGRFGGEPISRQIAQRLAREAGLAVVESVSKRLDLLVVADPHTQSGKANKARRYGTRILAEAVFWQALGVAVE